MRFVRTLAGAAAGVGLVALGAWAVRPAAYRAPAAWAGEYNSSQPPDAPDRPAGYDVVGRPPEVIPPGTEVGKTAPKGWSHLVIKSLPRIRPADRGKVNDLTARMASWMFTAFVADVRPAAAGGPNRLRAVALGLGCNVKGRDLVVTPETGDRLGADLGLVTRRILSAGYDRQKDAVVVFQGPTAGLVDTPVWYKVGRHHKLVRFRYALLVGGPGGSLDTVCWGLGPDGQPLEQGACVWLRPDTIDEAELLVDKSEFRLGVPSEAAFGVDGLPPARARLQLPQALLAVAAQTKFTPDSAGALEAGLRKLLATAPAAP